MMINGMILFAFIFIATGIFFIVWDYDLIRSRLLLPALALIAVGLALLWLA